MERIIINRPAHPQCAVCFQSVPEQLSAVCVMCGQALCQIHRQPTLFTRLFGWLDFGGLHLNGIKAQECTYCPKCVRQRFHPSSLFCDLALLARRTVRLIPRAWISHWPLLPTSPTFQVEVTEQLAGAIRCDVNEQYEASTAEEAVGQLVVNVQLSNRDRDRVAAYQRKYWLTDLAPVRIGAGFVQVQPVGNLTFERPPAGPHLPPYLLNLESEVAAFPYLTESQPTSDHKWQAHFPYTVKRGDGKNIPLPVQLIPTVVADGTNESIEFQVQLRPDIARWLDFEWITIEELTLRLPPRLHPIQRVRPTSASLTPKNASSPSSPEQAATWKVPRRLIADAPPVSYTVRLAAPLSDPVTLRGRIKLICNGTLSQIKTIAAFHRWGHLHKTQPQTKLRTHVTIGFALSLNPLAFQTSYVYNPPGKEKYFEGIAPNEEYVNALLKELNRQGFYIRKVLENPAHVHKNDALRTVLLWEVEGRHYDGVFPFDFHIELAGEVEENHPERGCMSADVTVQAVGCDNAVREEVERLHNRLVAVLAAAKKAVEADRASRPRSAPTGKGWPRILR